MGSINPPLSSTTDQEEITILVTGFAPFRTQNPINPAWEIARSLPPFLPQSEPTTSIPGRASPKVRILVHPEPVRVAYKAVRELVPRLWSKEYGVEEGNGNGRNKIDYMIHIGMATGRKWYSIERKGHRDGYVLKDVDGEICEDELHKGDGPKKEELKLVGDAGEDNKNPTLEKQQAKTDDNGEDSKEKWIWEGLPSEIETAIDVDDVWKRWRISLPSHDLRISNDAGRYLCDFIFYSSLAELVKRDEEKRVLFLHVPIDVDEEAVRNGVQITCELIRGIVASERLKSLGALGR